MRTKSFKSGNSLAVRLPAAVAYPDGTELEIVRTGDVTTIYPVRNGGLKEAIELLQRMPKPDTIEVLERIELPEREWD